jgi:UDPglucose 6-dehydrogenase
VILGIVGFGYVGQAVHSGLADHYNIEVYDKYQESSCNSLADLCQVADIIFVCVPTPMNSSGICDISIVDSVIKEINRFDKSNLVVVKSTVPPGTTNALIDKYKNIQIVFSPEFLTEASYIEDFKNSNRVIFGGSAENTLKIEQIFRSAYPDKIYVLTDATTAEMVKYVANTFLATKVAFANEIYDICGATGVKYKEVVEFAKLDKRLGNSHWQVPGPDKKRGFGGSCFPKDINGLIAYAESIDIEPKILKTVWKKNLQVRPERDWEELVGRAISKKEKNNE